MKKLSILSSFGLLLAGCNKPVTRVQDIPQCNNQKETYDQYRKCDLGDINHYYSTLIGDVEKNDKIVLWVTGGPQKIMPVAKMREVKFIKKVLPLFGQSYDVFKEEKITFAVLNQPQWMKQNSFNSKTFDTEFTAKDGRKEIDETVKKLHQLIIHFKDKGKKVLIGGESYGGFLMNEYLAQYGDGLPDHILSVAARLKLANLDKMKELLAQNKFPLFTTNDRSLSIRDIDIFLKNLAGEIVTEDYTKKISDQNLSKVTFLSSEPDQHVGWLNKEEQDWAKARSANVSHYTYNQTKQYFDNYEKIFGMPFKHGMGNTIKTYAHNVGFWTKDQLKKYFVNPFAK